MNMFLLIASIVLAAAATADGVSTAQFVKRGFVEVDPLMVFFYRTNTPSNAKIAWIGGALIAAEIGIAFTISHFLKHYAIGSIGFGATFLAQAAIHTYETIRNRNL